MNNNVTDIFQALKNLEGKISSLEKTVDDQQECICNLIRINDRLRKENGAPDKPCGELCRC